MAGGGCLLAGPMLWGMFWAADMQWHLLLSLSSSPSPLLPPLLPCKAPPFTPLLLGQGIIVAAGFLSVGIWEPVWSNLLACCLDWTPSEMDGTHMGCSAPGVASLVTTESLNYSDVSYTSGCLDTSELNKKGLLSFNISAASTTASSTSSVSSISTEESLESSSLGPSGLLSQASSCSGSGKKAASQTAVSYWDKTRL